MFLLLKRLGTVFVALLKKSSEINDSVYFAKL